MRNSVLIYGGSKDGRNNETQRVVENVHPTEILTIQALEGKKSIGLDQVKGLIKFLQKAPITGKGKAGIIKDSEKLTTEAQNALLKTLEEPPAGSTIVLEAKTHDSLLPTVISRCQKVFAGSKEGRGVGRGGGEAAKSVSDSLGRVKTMTLNEKLEWAQETAKEERGDLVELLESWIYAERENLNRQPQASKNLSSMINIKEDLEKTNVNARLALETLLLNLE